MCAYNALIASDDCNIIYRVVIHCFAACDRHTWMIVNHMVNHATRNVSGRALFRTKFIVRTEWSARRCATWRSWRSSHVYWWLGRARSGNLCRTGRAWPRNLYGPAINTRVMS